MEDKLSKLLVFSNTSIKEAMKKMDIAGTKMLIVIDRDKRLIGVLTDGDIRRFILKCGNIQAAITGCYNRTPVFVQENDNRKAIKKLMIERKLEALPVVDKNNYVKDLLIWNEMFGVDKKPISKIDCPVVIMAGGIGSRLDPLTRIVPKPLIPIGDIPVVEIIMNRFYSFGIKDFTLIVNYKGEMIKSYFDSTDLDYNLVYICEKEFRGTIGSLRFLPKTFPDVFIVSNCDIIVDVDYADLIQFHKDNNNKLTMVGSLKYFTIPYGVIEFSNNGSVNKIIEKPEYNFTVNSGIYVFNKKILKYIPNRLFHTTDLIKMLLKVGETVGVYPISEKSYIDIGQWEEYRKGIKILIGEDV